MGNLSVTLIIIMSSVVSEILRQVEEMSKRRMNDTSISPKKRNNAEIKANIARFFKVSVIVIAVMYVVLYIISCEIT